MFIVADPDHTDADALAAPDVDDWFAYARERGQYALGVRCEGRDTARTVRVRDGETIVTEGTFTDSVEWVQGVSLIEADSIEEAVELARRNPSAHWGRIELRPVHSFGGPLTGDE
jgi:hypothetical protein